MYTLKGFINNAAFVNNTPGSTAVIGELSTQSSTYSLSKGYYSDDSVADLSLVSFLSQDSATGAIEAPADIALQVLQIAAFVYAQTQATPNPGQIASTTLLASLLAQFQTSAGNFTCGTMVTDGTYWVPQWLAWENTTDTTYGSVATSDANSNEIKIWFTDAAFNAQYDEYDIVVVPPMATLDNFFTTASNVNALLSAQTFVDTMTLIQTAKGNNPESLLEAESYNYVDPTDATNLIATNWTVLIYGIAGNTVDAIAEAIIDYVLANSSHTQAEWTAILPDLFKRTEFTLVPMWDQTAIAAKTGGLPVYSPVANPSRALAMMTEVASTYTDDHINSNTCVQTFPYNNIALISCGSPNNANAAYQLEDVFPDILSVSSQSLDFGRQAVTTQDFVLLVASMLAAAETMTEYGSPPTGMTTLTRNNILYLVATYDAINYLMVVKANFPLANVSTFGADGVYVAPTTDGSSTTTTS
ncbi:hypothetical protein [Paraburkholderia sp. BCC1886]|uniref:hypothetical protein n=1 Tax=Paraburkholderia sp. BCC1886 TaxID=2562670 RepID=UPI001183A1DF|nr:hypothetical protein [Paraburkholderia sp. BCC1886]